MFQTEAPQHRPAAGDVRGQAQGVPGDGIVSDVFCLAPLSQLLNYPRADIYKFSRAFCLWRRGARGCSREREKKTRCVLAGALCVPCSLYGQQSATTFLFILRAISFFGPPRGCTA